MPNPTAEKMTVLLELKRKGRNLLSLDGVCTEKRNKGTCELSFGSTSLLLWLKIETATAALLTWMSQFTPKIPLWDEHQPLTYLSKHLCATCRAKPIILSQLWHGEGDMTKRTQQEQKNPHKYLKT